MIDHEKFENVPFESLIGEHILDAVDRSNEQVKDWGDRLEDAACLRFRLDGKIYVALEDPDDGYRSAMEKLFVQEGTEMQNVFPPVKVLARLRVVKDQYYDGEPDILEFIDTANGKVILAVGTDHAADYYPSFVAEWNPQNMAQNARG